jgi:hypothetical protein
MRFVGVLEAPDMAASAPADRTVLANRCDGFRRYRTKTVTTLAVTTPAVTTLALTRLGLTRLGLTRLGLTKLVLVELC